MDHNWIIIGENTGGPVSWCVKCGTVHEGDDDFLTPDICTEENKC